MKNLILIGVFLYANILVSFPQKLVEKDKKWSIAEYSSIGRKLDICYYLKIGTDTIVNNRNYSQLLYCSNSNELNWSKYGFIREDSSKIYYLTNENMQEIKLYDFNMGVGDSIFCNRFIRYVYVDSVKYQQMHNIKLKFIYLSEDWGSTSWIESIGCIDGLLYNSGNIQVAGGWTDLVCCKIKDSIIYMNPKYNTCFLSTNINESPINKDSQLSQNSPNPFKECSLIKFNIKRPFSHANISFYSLDGKFLKRIEILRGEPYEITVKSNEFQPGIYFYKLIIDGNEHGCQKMAVIR